MLKREKCKKSSFWNVTKALTKTPLEFEFYLVASGCQLEELNTVSPLHTNLQVLNFTRRTVCSHVQSCKLVPEAGVRGHVRASSAGGCAACPPPPAAHGPLALPPPPPLPPPVIILACLLSGSPCMPAVVLYYCTVPKGTAL